MDEETRSRKYAEMIENYYKSHCKKYVSLRMVRRNVNLTKYQVGRGCKWLKENDYIEKHNNRTWRILK